ncbi:MAG: LamG domain-containing protein [Phycisphaerae bacterium]
MRKKQILPGIFVALLLITIPVYAVENYKISDYGGGHQIWFEAEDFDERNPDTDQYFPVVDEAGAFGQAITRAGGAGGMIRWTFNIGAAGGKGGTWYFWGRVINPSNQSDFMLVEGHPGEPQIPADPPFPGTSSAAGFTNEHRVFEENIGPPWEWGRSGHGEAHTKQLQDGENTMYILHRQGNDTVFWDVFMWTDSPDYVPTDEDYQNARIGLGFGPATRPDPANGALYTDTWASLGWRPGDFALSHDVYLGDNFEDVNNGTPDSSGFQGNQPLTSTFFVVGVPGFPYPDGLVPGTTYYWRIDEVNDLDPNSPWKGPVWSFTIPPRTAYAPNPADGTKFVNSDLTLSWEPGFGVKLHYVYFGDNFDDVNNATVGLPIAVNTHTPGTLELEKTYYWRVDEFDGIAAHKGDVWSFKTLPDVPITDPNLVGWWKFEAGEGTTVIDFSGHGNHGTLEPGSRGSVQWVPGMFNLALEFPGDDQGHVELPAGLVTTAKGSVAIWVNTDLTDNEGMFWYGTETGGDGFGDENEIHIHIDDPGVLGFAIEGATDVRLDGPQLAGAGWTHVAATWDLTDGCRLYANGVQVDFVAHNNTVVDLTVIRLGRPVGTGNGNRYHDGLMDDVRLFDHAISAAQVVEAMRGDPLLAWSPNPTNGSTLYIRDATPLSWSAGENASEHDVYFGTDQAAVVNADASDTTGVYRGRQGVSSYNPPEGVEWGGGPYYWRIDEYNTDATISKGNVWRFTVADFIVIDDFESYNDLDPDDPESNRIFNVWIDGYGIPTNGSIVGYENPPFTEQSIVHSGGQSMPFSYDNSVGYSEATLTLTYPRDWTEEGVGVLSLWFYGVASNVAEPMYVALNGNAVVYHDNANAAQIEAWTEWTIDLQAFADQGVNLANVNTIAIGLGNKKNPVAGGSGTIYIDDIRLYRPAQ